MNPVTLTADMPIQSSKLQAKQSLVIVRNVPRTMFVEAHETQCRNNHSQTLERIRERGGFSAAEALAVLSCTFWGDLGAVQINVEYAHRLLYAMVAAHNRGMRIAEGRA